MSHNRPTTVKRSLFRRIIAHTALLLNVAAMGWLALCHAASVTSPGKHPYLALMSLSTPFALLANIFFLPFWLLARRKWRLLLPVAALGLSWKLLTAVFGWHFFAKPPLMQPHDFKVMTWNVHGMGIFDRPRNAHQDDSILAFIRRESPDILVMPEYYTIYSNALKPYSTTILAQNGYKEFRFKDDNSLGTKIYLGTAFFSKYRLREYEAVKLDKYVFLVQCDIALSDTQTIRLCAVHLQSFLLADNEKSELQAVRERRREIGMDESKSYMRRFAEAYKKRAAQADLISKHIQESPYPVLLCGDFNDLPASYSYTTILGKMGDAFADAGKGFGRTYHLFSPTLRIDYIFYDKERLQALSCRTPFNRYSDHNPVIATFRLKPAP